MKRPAKDISNWEVRLSSNSGVYIFACALVTAKKGKKLVLIMMR